MESKGRSLTMAAFAYSVVDTKDACILARYPRVLDDPIGCIIEPYTNLYVASFLCYVK